MYSDNTFNTIFLSFNIYFFLVQLKVASNGLAIMVWSAKNDQIESGIFRFYIYDKFLGWFY